MPIILRSILFGTGLLFAAATANAQSYYSGYQYPGYTANPHATYPAPSYYVYWYPYTGSQYYYYPRQPQQPKAYNDPYVAERPYSDGAGPKAN